MKNGFLVQELPASQGEPGEVLQFASQFHALLERQVFLATLGIAMGLHCMARNLLYFSETQYAL